MICPPDPPATTTITQQSFEATLDSFDHSHREMQAVVTSLGRLTVTTAETIARLRAREAATAGEKRRD